jgi:hypothetical protein
MQTTVFINNSSTGVYTYKQENLYKNYINTVAALRKIEVIMAKTKIDRGGGGQRLSIVTEADGYPVISYRDGDFGALKIAKCNNIDCSNSTISMVDSLGDVASSTSIAIGNDGLPIISYTDSGSNALKIAHCGRPSCR